MMDLHLHQVSQLTLAVYSWVTWSSIVTVDRRLVRAALRSRMGKRDRLNEGADRGRRAGGGADKRQR